MRIAIASDLHLEFGRVELISAPADILVLAGDICVAGISGYYEKFFEACAVQFEKVLYVLGNHEFYGGNIETTADALREKLGYIRNLWLMDDYRWFPIGLSGAIVGTTLWSEIPIAEEGLVAEFMTDYYEISTASGKLTVRDENELHRERLAWLAENIMEAEVVITHHLPSYRSVAPKYRNSPVNSAFANRLDDLIAANPQIKLWVHGHTHEKLDYRIGETRIVCNPRGYYGIETKRVEFETVVVEV